MEQDQWIHQKCLGKNERRKNQKEEEWWDDECRKKSEDLKRVLRKAKIRKEYKVMIERKQEEKARKLIKKMEEDKTMKTFTESITIKKMKVEVSKKIRTERWMEHLVFSKNNM